MVYLPDIDFDKLISGLRRESTAQINQFRDIASGDGYHSYQKQAHLSAAYTLRSLADVLEKARING